MKEFVKKWKPKNLKEWDKEYRQDVLRGSLEGIVDFYLTEGHQQKNREVITELFNAMQGKHFIKTLEQLINPKKKKERARIDLAFVMIINDFIESRYSELEKSDEGADLINRYSDLVSKLLKKRVKEVGEKTGVNEDLIKEVLVVATHPGVVKNDRFIGIHVRNVLRKVYALAKENGKEIQLDSPKKVKKLFAELFGSDKLNLVAVAVLLERKDSIRNFNESQMAVWNHLTEFALTTLEDNKKKEIAELIVERYVGLRESEDKKGRDSARRIQFSSISEENYPKVIEVTSNLAEKDKYKKYL